MMQNLQPILSTPAYVLPDRRNPRLASYRRFVDTQIKPLAGVTAEYPAELLTARRAAFVAQIQIGKVAT